MVWRFGFEQTLRLELGKELRAGVLICGEIVFGQNNGLAGEGVAESVEGGSAFAFGGGGDGGVGGVLTVDGGAMGGGRGLMWIHGNTLDLFSRGGVHGGAGLDRDVGEEAGVGGFPRSGTRRLVGAGRVPAPVLDSGYVAVPGHLWRRYAAR